MSKEKYFNSLNERIVAWVISCAMFMESLDTTIINTAIPEMSRSLNVNPIDLKVALISYLISLAIFIPISGWIADKYGAKNVFISALMIFTISSILCGFSEGVLELVCARILQGIGGSLMLPVGRLLILRTFGRNRMVIAMNKVVTVGILGAMLGPVLGGFISRYFSWHWIFWVNIPFGIIAMVLTKLYFIKSEKVILPNLDIIGFILFGSSLSGITFGFSTLSETMVPQLYSICLIFISVLVLIIYFIYSRHSKNPIIKMNLFNFRTFKISILGNLLSRLGFGGIPFLLPLLLQMGLGYPAQISGLLLSPIAIGVVVSKQFTFQLLKYLGYKKLLIINTLVVGFSLWSCMLITNSTSIYLT